MKFEGTTEVLFSFLCSANNHIARIGVMVQRLAVRGQRLEGEFFAFPSCETIAEVAEQELRSEGFGYRGATIPKVASGVAGVGVVQCKEMGYEAIRQQLMAFPGVGPKLADCVALFGFHHLQAVPLDTHLWSVMQREYFPEWREKALTDRRYQVAADFFRDRFGFFAGWAQQILFYDQLLNWRSRKPDKVPVGGSGL